LYHQSFFAHAAGKIAVVVGVFNETRTPPSQMPFLQTMVHHRSPQPSSPKVLSENQMPEGQQGGEPKALAIETDKPKTLVRPGRSGAGSGVAQVASVLLETCRTQEIDCATRFHRCGLRQSAIME
jgi:hypothetical protein